MINLRRRKIAIRPRPNKSNANEMNEAGLKGNPMRSVEERNEEYDRARARIFSGSRSSDASDALSQVPVVGRNCSVGKDENEAGKNPTVDSEKCTSVKDIGSTRVAILRDRDKDRSDPDYDRSHGRCARGIPNFDLVPSSLLKVPPSFAQMTAISISSVRCHKLNFRLAMDPRQAQ